MNMPAWLIVLIWACLGIAIGVRLWPKQKPPYPNVIEGAGWTLESVHTTDEGKAVQHLKHSNGWTIDVTWTPPSE